MCSPSSVHRVAAVLLAVCAASPVVAQNTSDARECRDEQGLTYICNLVVPEDVVSVGLTGLMLASGHRAPGHMYLIDPADGIPVELIHGPTFRQRRDTAAYPDCPGPLDLERFDVHGISINETAPRRFTLYTTSHGAREAIEIYELDLNGAAPALTWTGCVLLEQDGYFNAVARLVDGGFIATRMRDANVSNNSIEPGAITGRLFEWHPGGRLQALAGTELSLPNGLDVSSDGRYVFVAATATQELVRFDRRATPIGKRTVSLPIRPDNVHWDGRGKLLIAGPNPADPTCDRALCPSGWRVVEADPETLAFSVLGGADKTAASQRVSAAARIGNEIWVGGNEDRIARFTVE
jgi:SMP-30/Gluconolactonase/LRE-like region